MHSIGITTALLTGFLIGTVFGSLADGIHTEGAVVKLEKLQDESGEFEFEFASVLSGAGETVRLSVYLDLYLMIIDNNTIYGAEIDDYRKSRNSPFYVFARPAEWTEHGIVYTNDHESYIATFSPDGTSSLVVAPYDTLWDTGNVCFTKNSEEAGTFLYALISKNNRRTFTGETNIKHENPFVQYIDIIDTRIGLCGLVASITANEFNLSGTFCKATIYKPGKIK